MAPAPLLPKTTTGAVETTDQNKSTTEDENDQQVVARLSKRAPAPIGTFLWNQLRLASPAVWWGVADIRKIDTRPLWTSLLGILLPLVAYQLLTRGHCVSSSSSRCAWIQPVAQTTTTSFLPLYLASPWTLSMLWRGSTPLVGIYAAMKQMLEGRSACGVAAWQTLVEQVESGRAYRMRGYDVYLPVVLSPTTTSSSSATTTLPADALTTTTGSTVVAASSSSKPLEHAIIFLPGAGVEHVAYSESATLLSNAGFTVVVVGAEPLRMAFSQLGTNAACIRRIQRTIERQHAQLLVPPPSRTNVRKHSMTWSLLGHSLGSFTACQLAQEFCPETEFAGGKVVMWGSAPFVDYLPDLSGNDRLPVLVVQGSKDGIIEAFATKDLTKQFWERLPKDTAEHVLEGGTHSGFANYVSLWTKKEVADIPKKEQHRLAVQATVEFLQRA